MQQFAKYLSLILLAVSTLLLIPLQMKMIGWPVLLLGLGTLLLCEKQFRKDIFLIYVSLALLGITEITTNTSPVHFLQMMTTLSLAVAIPYFVSRYFYKDYLVHFQFHHGRNWYKLEIFYIFFAGIVTYFSFPFMLWETHSYLNWTVNTGFNNLLILFIGTNSLGIWDELFFISTVLGILKRHLAFPLANLLQATMFTSFLFELGFRGWTFLLIFLFALLQGYVFKRTQSLFYLITIHLVVDLVLYLALIYLYHPALMPIFFFK